MSFQHISGIVYAQLPARCLGLAGAVPVTPDPRRDADSALRRLEKDGPQTESQDVLGHAAENRARTASTSLRLTVWPMRG
jgi:hypothetical protein